MSKGLKELLAPSKDQELLQSFVRVGIGAAAETTTHDEEVKEKKTPGEGKRMSTVNMNRRKSLRFAEPEPMERELLRTRRLKMISSENLKKKKPKESFNDYYTDKDRAAAVSAGSFDIKQSLKIKQKQERQKDTSMPDESDISAYISLGLKEIKTSNFDNALQTLSKALDLNCHDLNALIARSRCYLCLGEPSKALTDAETALSVEKSNIRALFQKAESLYYLGQFEQSLMYFHRGLRARPELDMFRLGVQKTQEAIENTIGNTKAHQQAAIATARKQKFNKPSGDNTPAAPRKSKATKADIERRNTRKLLGELCVDKQYLENLLKDPNLRRADTNTENISIHAKEAVEFLNKRQEFWRQQRPCTALPLQKNLKLSEIAGLF